MRVMTMARIDMNNLRTAALALEGRTVRNAEPTPRRFPPKWMTVKDAAEYLGVSTDFVRDMMVDGLSYYKVRHTCFVSLKDLDDYIGKHKIF